MASLLSLCPSRSIEEKQNLTRKNILNSPALPSSSGLITSFGGLKKEEQLSKSMALTRNTLGITVKRNKLETEENKTKVVDSMQKSENCEEAGDNLKIGKEHDGNIKESVIKKVSLVVDYSSSDGASD